MSNEKVSIILPTYNRAYILGKAVESVLNQTYPYFELVIVDDGSTDNTKKLLSQYKDERIIYHYTKSSLYSILISKSYYRIYFIRAILN